MSRRCVAAVCEGEWHGRVCVCVFLRGTLAELLFVCGVGWGGGECGLLVYVVHKHVRVTVCVTVSAISVIRVCEKLALGQTIL